MISTPNRALALPAMLTIALAAASTFAAGPISDAALKDYRDAVHEAELGHWEQAQTRIEAIVEMHPNPTLSLGYRPYFELARVRMQRGDFDGAQLSLDIGEGLLPQKVDRGTRREYRQLRSSIDQLVYGPRAAN